jgi:hypothetical protein
LFISVFAGANPTFYQFYLQCDILTPKGILPAGLPDTRDLTRQRHIPEHIPGDAEVTDISPGTARQLTTVMQSNRRRIPGQLIQRLVITSGFQSGALFSIFSR